MPWDAEIDDDSDDDSGFDTSGADDDNTLPCPFCGAEIFEDADRCTECGRYLTREEATGDRKPWWLVVGVVICLLIVLSWALGAGVTLLW